MPELRDLTLEDQPVTILALGNTGSGKTTLGLTAPGKKFAYYFDQNALNTAIKFKKYADFELTYETYFADHVNLDVRSMSKGKGDRISVVRGDETYVEWEKHLENMIEKGLIKPYDWMIFDSLTTFSDMVMDRVLTINNRYGDWPHQDDWGPQMNTIAKVFRTLTSLGINLFVTGHLDIKQDELSKRIFQVPLLTGRLRMKLPLLFSQIWICEATTVKDEVKYTIQTVPDRMTPIVRNTIEGLDHKHDVTINFNKPLNGQGLAEVLK